MCLNVLGTWVKKDLHQKNYDLNWHEEKRKRKRTLQHCSLFFCIWSNLGTEWLASSGIEPPRPRNAILTGHRFDEERASLRLSADQSNWRRGCNFLLSPPETPSASWNSIRCCSFELGIRSYCGRTLDNRGWSRCCACTDVWSLLTFHCIRFMVCNT